MILPPRPENHPRPEPPRHALDLPAALDPHPRRNRPELDRFAPTPWDRLSPQWLQIEDTLPADHLARALDEAVNQLDLTAWFASYAGVGSKAHRPDLFLKIVLSEIQSGCLRLINGLRMCTIADAFRGWDWGSCPRGRAAMSSATDSGRCWRP
jgi:hypothetical protein